MNSISKATKDDLKNIALVHKKAYSKFHFTSFFSLELLEHYYRYFLDDGSTILLLNKISDNGEISIQGFVVCGVDMAHKIKQFKSDYKLEILKTALQHPFKAINKIIDSLYHKLFGKSVAYEETDFLILSIAVVVPREGIGSLLLKEAMLLGNKLEFDTIGLYVRVENIDALNSYLKNGFSIRGYVAGQYYMEV